MHPDSNFVDIPENYRTYSEDVRRSLRSSDSQVPSVWRSISYTSDPGLEDERKRSVEVRVEVKAPSLFVRDL